jgi:transcriptional regulator with GAF, ATPase, and Fis domain
VGVPQSTYELVGVSDATRAIQQEVEYAARSDAKILITGESGVGKEVVARLVHQRSRRANAPLMTINCAGLPDTLLETELFGHVRGSFTDAYHDKRGLLESANGGTLFMDEIGEMSLRMQALLLRFLENGEVQRVGAERPHTVTDVRLITATNRNLQEAIAGAVFREDLYYRINVVHLRIPPLRERPLDIEPLLDYYMRRFAESHRVAVPQLSTDARAYLTGYRWPGNVRELKNVVERFVVRGRSGVVEAVDLPTEVLTGRYAPVAPNTATPASTPAQIMYEQMIRTKESFWAVVYEPFMARDITRDDLRQLVLRGLEHMQGSYKGLVRLFNMPPQDYKRFLNFLRKYQCQMPFQPFRAGLGRSSLDLPHPAQEDASEGN